MQLPLPLTCPARGVREAWFLPRAVEGGGPRHSLHLAAQKIQAKHAAVSSLSADPEASQNLTSPPTMGGRASGCRGPLGSPAECPAFYSLSPSRLTLGYNLVTGSGEWGPPSAS